MSNDGSARVWDVGDRRELARLRHDQAIASAAFSPDGERILTASSDGTARVWNAASGRELVRLKHDREVSSAAFSADGQRVVTTSWDQTARVWDAFTGRELARVKHDRAVHWAGFSADGRRVMTGMNELSASFVSTWDVASRKELWRSAYLPTLLSVDHSADGQWAATAYSGGVAIWNAASGESIAVRQSSENAAVGPGGFSPDALRIMSEGLPFGSATFSLDGRRLLTATGDHSARIWDTSWLARHDEELVGAVCREKLGGARRLTRADVALGPLLLGRVGEDVCPRGR